MRVYGALLFRNSNPLRDKVDSIPLIRLSNATFYRQYPRATGVSAQADASNPPLFPNVSLEIPAFSSRGQNWAVVSPSSNTRTQFLQILRGQLLADPPHSRSYPYLASPELSAKSPHLRTPERAIHYVGFDAERRPSSGEYLSARYESRVEATDFTVAQYLRGVTGLNEGEERERERPSEALLRDVVARLGLERFRDRPVGTLSNGQSRRARIARALLREPELLLLDAPFIGLDPFATQQISEVLMALAEAGRPRVLISLRPQDAIPEWITHLFYAREDATVEAVGKRKDVIESLERSRIEGAELPKSGTLASNRASSISSNAHRPKPSIPELSRDGFTNEDSHPTEIGEPVVEMQGVNVKYGSNSVLGDWHQESDGAKKGGLWWTVRQGQRWGIFGANGSGKTTLLSLITSDHPQTYSAPVRIFGRSRLPSPGVPGISIFDIQSRMGHASPEIHSLFPKYLSVRRALESAWADTPITVPALDGNARQRVEACLRWFKNELTPVLANRAATQASSGVDWAKDLKFGELSFSAQRVTLFLRAVIRNPDVVILDEAFSGMDGFARDKCMLFLSQGEAMELPDRNEREAQDGAGVPRENDAARRGAVTVPGLLDRQAFLCVSHSPQDVPGCVREWLCLPEGGEGPPRTGKFTGPVELDTDRWKEVWNIK